MSIYRRGVFWLYMVILLTAGAGIVDAFNYNPRVRLLPLIVGVFIVVLCVYSIIGEKYPAIMDRFNVSVTDVAGADSGDESKVSTEADGEISRGRTWATGAWLVGFFGAIVLLGFLLAVPLFVFAFIKWYGRIGWLSSLLAAMIVEGIIYASFDIAMKAVLFEGLLFGGKLPPL